MKLKSTCMSVVLLLTLSVCTYKAGAQDAKPAENAAEKRIAVNRTFLYRLTYTLTEMDGDKRIGVQHVMLNAGFGESSSKTGSKVPVGPQYYDVGLNITVHLTVDDGVKLWSLIDQSTIGETVAGESGGQLPVIRHANLANAIPLVVSGKPVVLGSYDVPGSTRHTEVTLLVEKLI
jgi:hypothetical protein